MAVSVALFPIAGRQDEQGATNPRTGLAHPEARLKPLIEGYRRFRASEWPKERERFELTAEHGQRPHTLVIACSDSRVDPQMILGAHPGELFVVRNVANLVPPHERDEAHHGTSAAIEFAVRILGVERILVLGHGMCGGVKMLLEDPTPVGFDFATRWMDLAKDAKSATAATDPPEARHKACEEATVRLSLTNLLTFPWVAERVDAKSLTLHGGYFDIRYGALYLLQSDGSFATASAGDQSDRP